ncbi:hypothetical protein IF1G_00847 [Cordyceps javanica]|uniref:Uncharacterized protein n=1 Tax=Cordyceps javanica TaxID=43265 RepID=A0A545VGS4_9HYPO|nr:hypothetical protein IF1G_00847 [Cordyceps javanica]
MVSCSRDEEQGMMTQRQQSLIRGRTATRAHCPEPDCCRRWTCGRASEQSLELLLLGGGGGDGEDEPRRFSRSSRPAMCPCCPRYRKARASRTLQGADEGVDVVDGTARWIGVAEKSVDLMQDFIFLFFFPWSRQATGFTDRLCAPCLVLVVLLSLPRLCLVAVGYVADDDNNNNTQGGERGVTQCSSRNDCFTRALIGSAQYSHYAPLWSLLFKEAVVKARSTRTHGSSIYPASLSG